MHHLNGVKDEQSYLKQFTLVPPIEAFVVVLIGSWRGYLPRVAEQKAGSLYEKQTRGSIP